MDPEAVGGEEGLATALLITDEGVLSSVSLLVGAEVACCAVGARASLKGALVPLYLTEDRGYLISREKQLPRVSPLHPGTGSHEAQADSKPVALNLLILPSPPSECLLACIATARFLCSADK